MLKPLHQHWTLVEWSWSKTGLTVILEKLDIAKGVFSSFSRIHLIRVFYKSEFLFLKKGRVQAKYVLFHNRFLDSVEFCHQEISKMVRCFVETELSQIEWLSWVDPHLLIWIAPMACFWSNLNHTRRILNPPQQALFLGISNGLINLRVDEKFSLFIWNMTIPLYDFPERFD